MPTQDSQLNRVIPRSLHFTEFKLHGRPDTTSDSRVLDQFAILQQDHSQWSWVATGLSICRFHQDTGVTSQCQMVNRVFKRTDCCHHPIDPSCNRESDFGDVLKINGNFVMKLDGRMPFADVKNEIKAGHPIPVQLHWKLGGEHSVVIYGYYEQDRGNRYLLVQDPGNETKSVYNYQRFPTDGCAKWISSGITKQ